ncbi:Protein of unknown function [Pseudomonas sp. UC 17F4]|uniref:DUF4238 domain-containing protein n=1 Tax=Pseudomonas sp. UC 17F4 TaxID=1855328 RepID=UPI000887E34C|nr:DUF4238 domain-containing protein [Pseudomonas sp. UC 17F4]SDQ55221.1 Protein of unknown function [Pseudomonas sp. UC 17F4]
MTTKRQHFVPQAYLKGFSEVEGEPFIWAYDKREGRRRKRDSVKAFGYLDYYYEQETESGERDSDSMEKTLSRTVDNELPSLIKKLRITPGTTPNITDEEKGKLAYFIGLTLTRGPSFRDGINNLYSQIANIEISHLAQHDERLRKALSDNLTKVEAKPWVSLRPMLEVAHQVAQSILGKNWQFFQAADSVPFLTSDNPVVIGGKQIVGPCSPFAELLIPLRKDLALVCTHHGTKPIEAFKQSPIQTRHFNRGIVRAAKDRVFSCTNSDAIERLVKKYSSDHQHITI